MSVVAIVLVIAGVIVLAISTLGVITLPDFFGRAHAVAKSETLGILLTLGGLIIHHGWNDGSVTLVVVLIIALIANPTAVHALARAAATDAPAAEGRPGPRQEPPA